jgi:hypothetical protein
MKAIAKHMLYYVLLAAVGLCVYLALSGHAQAAETAVTASQGLEGALVDIIQQVSGGVKQGVDFLQAEIPDVVRQLLVWKLAEAAVKGTLLFLFVLGLIPLVKWGRKYHETYDQYDFPGHIFLCGTYGFVSLFCAVGGVQYGLTALQIYIAPKVWLIEYAASLVK